MKKRESENEYLAVVGHNLKLKRQKLDGIESLGKEKEKNNSQDN